MADALKVKQMLEMVEPYAKVLRSVTVPSNVIIETLEYVREQEDLGKELTNAIELIHKKNKRIKDQQEEIKALKTGCTWGKLKDGEQDVSIPE